MLLSAASNENPRSHRISRLKESVQGYKPGICTERAIIWTNYHKQAKNTNESPHIRMAKALREVLMKKSIRIYPDELIVGNFSSKRVGGSLFPELHGIPMMEDIFKFSKRQTSPLQISAGEIRQLLGIVPFWILRFLGMKVYRSPLKKIRFLKDQLHAYFYIINETAGISHTAPDYEKLINIGVEGIISEVREYQKEVKENTEAWDFYEAVKIIAEAFARFGERYADLAAQMAEHEFDPETKKSLMQIARACRNVPRKGAGSFHEAIQSVFFAQIAIMTESLDSSICPGRMDQYLYPFYEADIRKGLITRETAKEMISAFSIKLCEIVPVFSERVVNLHGGFYNTQVVTVGGVDPEGNDATNELSYIFLEVMDELRMREPNFHARIHSNSPKEYMNKIISMLSSGSNCPALYNDDTIIKTMCRHGYDIRDARNYSGVGCVEPVSQGKSFSSTNAAMVNVPIILEMALNQGRRFGSIVRSGAKTMPVSKMSTMEDVKAAFESQLTFLIKRLIKDLHAVESANKKYHPTPFTSMLHDGCLRSGRCSTAGGASYNFSGIQCVAPSAVGDSLYAIEKAVFKDKKIPLPKLVDLLKRNINDPWWLAYLKGLEKFGNDDTDVDRWVLYVVYEFIKALSGFKNTRGGKYVAGIYSDTIHNYFGRITGASAHGRRKGESFASGIAPGNGMDRNGPTALINSVNRFDFTKIANGINFNLKFDSHTLQGHNGKTALGNILKTYFRRGGMQVQTNVLDPKELIRARNNPELYPNLLVRVSGYSVYFNDLAPEMKDEIISRRSYSA
jgi:pyruvate formate-lyase/glycerol dehydratase family glycyl radical enzyme